MADQSWSGKVAGQAAETPTTALAAPAAEADRPWLDRAHPLLMLDLRFASGNRMAFQYFDLIQPKLLGNILKLYFHQATVTIKGRHLSELYEKLLEHKILAVVERHKDEYAVPDGAPYIMEIKSDGPNAEAVSEIPR